MRIYLIGYMGSGKSTIGKQLASRLGYPFLDLDQHFEERYRISIIDFFEKYGELLFRNLERDLLHETRVFDDILISTGGGTPCSFDNMKFIRDYGIAVYIRWPVKLLAERLQNLKKKRPILKDLDPGALQEKIKEHLAEREPFYNQADIVIDAGDLSQPQLIEILLKKMEEFGKQAETGRSGV